MESPIPVVGELLLQGFTSHRHDDRVATIKRVKAEGLRTCVGGIFGMGMSEAPAYRVELALVVVDANLTRFGARPA